MDTWSSHVGAKYQITLPKHVREVLGIRHPGGLVGFFVDGSKITLTKAAITEEEWSKLICLAKTPVKRTSSAKQFLAKHRRLTRGD
jgi:AbrB family looped-hinge helix DNA binding protein